MLLSKTLEEKTEVNGASTCACRGWDAQALCVKTEGDKVNDILLQVAPVLESMVTGHSAPCSNKGHSGGLCHTGRPQCQD